MTLLPDVAESDLAALRQSGWFDAEWYLAQYPDVAQTGMDPGEHYLWIGVKLSRQPGPNAERGARPGALHGGSPVAAGQQVARRALANPFAANPSVVGPVSTNTAWPPPPINDFWPTQTMRDFIIGGYGEPQIHGYWYLCSVMATWRDDQKGFTEGTREVCEIMARLRDLARARAACQTGAIDATVIVPVYNNILDTLLCLATVLETAGAKSFEIIVADDGSNDATGRLIPQIGGNIIYYRQPENLGFLRNCNSSVARGVGRYVVLLNNDTLVLPDWLDALLAPFDLDPKIGLTGSKLVNWDGTLQEAGGIFWDDGSAWNFGRGSDARAPQFSYLKDVDYCSGASIAMPRVLWDELGGFDEHYLPAYCEDSDIAFRVRAAGYRSVYTPFSEVIHHEGRSHGRDVNSGIKAYQVANQAKLVERWGDVLRREHFPNAVNVLRARDRSRDKHHVLVVDHYVPQWDRDAGSRTIYQFLRAMLTLGWQVTFWPDNLHYDATYARWLQAIGVEVIHGPAFAGGFETFLQERSDLYDAVLLSRPHIATKYIEAVRAHTASRVLYYGHDLHFRRMENQRDLGLADAPAPAAIVAMRDLELSVCNRSDLVLYPSEDEARDVAGLVEAGVACKAVPAYCFAPAEIEVAAGQIGPRAARQGRRELLFVGGFAHSPNVDGIVWFVREVLPLLRGQLDLRLRVVGSKAPQEVYDLAAGDVEVLGFVSDERLLELYGEADIVVCPLRYGAGVKGKVVEAMARGLPVVTTDIGTQGLECAARHLFTGNTPPAFAEAVIAACDRDRAGRAARSALETVRVEFSEQSVGAVFAQALAAGRPN